MPHMGEFTTKKHAGLTAEADLHIPEPHASRHENAGIDEISVAGLSGELADNQPPKAHASDHEGGSDALTLTSIDSLAARVKTGTYTGDGSTSQAITGVGFQPIVIWVFTYETAEETSDAQHWLKMNQMYGDLACAPAYYAQYDNRLISLDSDGFTVDDDGSDSHPNQNGQDYVYIAWG